MNGRKLVKLQIQYANKDFHGPVVEFIFGNSSEITKKNLTSNISNLYVNHIQVDSNLT